MTREEAINQLQDAKDGYKEYLTNEALDMAIKALEQKPKTGYWIITYPHGKQNPIYECSRCHASNSSVFKNYCPNCGAKMESENI